MKKLPTKAVTPGRAVLRIFATIAWSAAFACACRPDQVPANWVDPRLSAHLHLVTKAPKTPAVLRLNTRAAAGDVAAPGTLKIWRGFNNSIGIDSPAAIEELKGVLGKSAAAVVTFSPGSRLGDQLADDPLTLAYHAGDEGASGFALVAIPDQLVLEGLAAAAHVANHHACGNLEVLSLAPLIDAAGLTPPIFDETVKLDQMDALLAAPLEANIEKTIQAMENMGSRHHTSENGIKTTAAVQGFMTDAGATKIAGAVFSEVDHDVDTSPIPTKQKSLIFAIPGTDDDATTVVIGAHMDSINRNGPSYDAPGSDDDASGIATLVEMVRAISANGAKFKRRVEFQAYAAEEVGLIGSGQIARQYAKDGRKVAAMFQLDMNSWSETAGTKTIYLVENDTSPTLRRSVKDLMNTYLSGDYVENSLLAGTSDHRSWTNAGYPAVFPFENPRGYNEALHSVNDNLKTINNLPLTARFAQLGLAFLAHHAGLVEATEGYEAEEKTAKAARSPDLKLAVIVGPYDGVWQISVSGDAAIKTVELCLTDTAGARNCTQERAKTTADKTATDRNFYLTNDLIAVANGVHVAVFGYDLGDKLVAQRTVRLKKK